MDKGESDLSRKCVMVPAAAEDGLTRIESPIASSFLGSRFWRMFDWSRRGVGLRLVAAVLHELEQEGLVRQSKHGTYGL